ncbi:MAG: hypothetical protein IKV90_09430 [Clostridia bacterium]|nr:hypothetical protein [Clostridia bacterium]
MKKFALFYSFGGKQHIGQKFYTGLWISRRVLGSFSMVIHMPKCWYLLAFWDLSPVIHRPTAPAANLYTATTPWRFEEYAFFL